MPAPAPFVCTCSPSYSRTKSSGPMGKKPKTDRARDGSFDYAGAYSRQKRGGNVHEPLQDPHGAVSANLEVYRIQNGAIFLSLLGFVSLMLIMTILVSPTPGLLVHWSFTTFTCFISAVSVLHFMAKFCMYAHTKQTAEERLAWLLFWGLGMVHGFVWITALVVPIYGTTPNTLWREYGEHGGSHMAAARFGSIPLLVAPPALLWALMIYERKHITCVYYDILYSMQAASGSSSWVMNAFWQLLCPLIPLGLWAATVRTPVFSDLQHWPPVGVFLAISVLANAPLYAWMLWASRNFQGPVFWLPEGAACVMCVPSSRIPAAGKQA